MRVDEQTDSHICTAMRQWGMYGLSRLLRSET